MQYMQVKQLSIAFNDIIVYGRVAQCEPLATHQKTKRKMLSTQIKVVDAYHNDADIDVRNETCCRQVGKYQSVVYFLFNKTNVNE